MKHPYTKGCYSRKTNKRDNNSFYPDQVRLTYDIKNNLTAAFLFSSALSLWTAGPSDRRVEIPSTI